MKIYNKIIRPVVIWLTTKEPVSVIGTIPIMLGTASIVIGICNIAAVFPLQNELSQSILQIQCLNDQVVNLQSQITPAPWYMISQM